MKQAPAKSHRPPGGDHVAPRTAFWPALSIWVLTLATAASALIYDHIHPLPPSPSAGQGSVANGVAAVGFIVGFATVGALLGWKRPANRIGWLLCASGLSYAIGALAGLLLQFTATRGWGHGLGWIWLFGAGFVVFVLLLFPTGLLPSRRWRPVAWIAAAAMAGWVLGNTFAPAPVDGSLPHNPIAVGGPAGHVIQLLGGVSGLLVAA